MADNQDVKHSTKAISAYDGIFKGMYDEGLREIFQEGRRMLSNGQWDAGKGLFKKMLELAYDKPNDKKTLTVLVRELERYEEQRIEHSIPVATDVQWTVVSGRRMQRLDELLFGLPQGVFFLDIGKPGNQKYVRLVGKKLISELFLAFKIPELFCSLIKADMILGLLAGERISDSRVTIFYYPLEKSEKLRVMNDIIKENGETVELTFPFPILKESTRSEWGSPAEGWEVDDAYDAMLSYGEERIRCYSIQFLKSKGLQKPVLFDPACSTGVFLSQLQESYPGSYTIGQDLSQQMANFAKERVDEVYCANALTPKIPLGTADVVYIRFLNSEVVKTCEAEDLLSALLPTVKENGYVVIFGHTPVLLSSGHFTMLNDFELKQSVGVDVHGTGIFQYYIIQKRETSDRSA